MLTKEITPQLESIQAIMFDKVANTKLIFF
jgi:hypothetical protein